MNILDKLLKGSKTENISPIWILLDPLESLASAILSHMALIPPHVMLEANKVVGKIANVGVTCVYVEIKYHPTNPNHHSSWDECQHMELEYVSHLDPATHI